MSRTAVTEDASAASDRFSEREPNSRFLPDDEQYRRTGEMSTDDLEIFGTQTADDGERVPEGIRAEREEERKRDQEQLRKKSEKKADSAPAEETAPSGEQDDDTAAASEAAPTQRTKTPAQSESRWAKLSRENRELRERLARVEAAQPVRETPQASQPAAAAPSAHAKPKIDDVDASGKPKYKTYAEYEDAKDQWLSDEAIRKFQETTEVRTREEQQRSEEAEIGKSLAAKFEAPRAKYADFDAVALGNHWINPRGSVTDLFLIDSDHAGEVAYYLGQHPEITQGFYGNFDPKTGKFTNLITPQRQFRKLMEIEAEVTGGSGESTNGKRPSARPVTQAPRPPHQVSGKGTISRDAAADAIENGDADTYMREMNARVLAERARK